MVLKTKIALGLLAVLVFATVVYATTWQSYGELTAGNIADGDDFLIRDVSDTTDDAAGTVVRYAWSSAKQSLGQTKGFVFNGITASDDFLLFYTPIAITITDIYGVLQSGTNVVGGLHYVDNDGSSNETAVDADITFDGGLDQDDGTLANGSVAADKWVYWKTTSVSSPGYLTVTIVFK